ncbi:HD-GYP domain-containing protein [Marinomonas pollencensis]|uniref:HD domain-containing protein n=1 Tax=Marinomonas pollencensis TaxID=491954 RepID=A0A3E0DSC6_9GAMM|nr:HD domain-containing phosphohydrolase [Marinomonas pollencensis]REG84851.1 HD domain-containing protein [Marinomonas pollencensis]
MTSFQIESCFGAEIGAGYFDIDEILDIFKIKNAVVNHKRAKKLILEHGRKERIVSVVLRQLALDEVRPVLESKMLPFDPYFNDDQLLNSRQDRLYDAQERFLMLCFSIATGKSVRSLKKLHEGLSSKEWREKSIKGGNLFRYFRQELNDNTREYILSYKARLESIEPDREGRKRVPKVEAKPLATPEPKATREPSIAQSDKGITKRSNIEPTGFNDEVVTAFRLFEDGHSLLLEQVERFKQGNQLDIDGLAQFCSRLIESYSRNPHALMAIRHLKDASAYIAQHAMGMAVLGIHFARSMKLSEAYVDVIALGALLFDLGRFRLPTAMINKTTRMTDGEFDLFRKHIQLGEQIVRRSNNISKVIYHMLLDHHERVDGAGYPKGKVGKEISIYGKIAAIIDAYDALTSEQVHQKSMGPVRARRQLIKEAGLAFDKNLLAVFLKSIGRIPVGSCVSLSNGRVGFVLTLSHDFQPALVRQVYSVNNKTFIASTDIDLSKPGTSVEVVGEVDAQKFGLQFINHLI